MSSVSEWDQLAVLPCFGTSGADVSRSLSDCTTSSGGYSCADQECTSNTSHEETECTSQRTDVSYCSPLCSSHSENEWMSSVDFVSGAYPICQTRDATVFCRICKHTGRPLAIKSYRKANMDPESFINVAREVSIQKSLQQTPTNRFPGTVQLLGYSQDSESINVIQEMCNGLDLRSHMYNHGRSCEQDVSNIGSQLLETLHHLHMSGVIHRNIKPESVFWTCGGEVRLGGFKLAIEPQTMGPLTRVGSPDYCAPELMQSPTLNEVLHGDIGSIAGGQYDEKVDIWAVGVLVYELLIGATPRQMQEMCSGQPATGPLELYFPPFLSTHCVNFLLKALEEDPSARPSAQALSMHPWLRMGGH
mmetsp:Transcript_28892/g.81357  ORF Transcript_28892/g.81357 Transcript_28892/m.81357 type:complete len:361 (-) Transcript_28892:365-1447(-)|eukprot:CAMPEP_0117666416 /NCGR_PEP_ID=MMETSP0804-20121206/10365_1 /TAXON_ID=1074897 /ORGANISM="Tetraselmis astigmatica, Strain CCMP880" /LENGTH=360 /DNA_ID=CAMNT_0005473961 /DNA_START=184 /DNA_END=1266 /DNA_ORIENTATION=+